MLRLSIGPLNLDYIVTWRSARIQILDPKIRRLEQSFLDPEFAEMVGFLNPEIVEIVIKSDIFLQIAR